MINLIAAVSYDWVLAIDGKIPWHVKEDLQLFRERTLGCPIIMGSATFRSLKRPLSNRLNIVLTKDTSLKSDRDDVVYVNTIEDAFKVEKIKDYSSSIWVIGGANVYKQFLELNLVDRVVLSYINTFLKIERNITEFPYDAYRGWLYRNSVYSNSKDITQFSKNQGFVVELSR